jgi:hypothetical protein
VQYTALTYLYRKVILYSLMVQIGGIVLIHIHMFVYDKML